VAAFCCYAAVVVMLREAMWYVWEGVLEGQWGMKFSMESMSVCLYVCAGGSFASSGEAVVTIKASEHQIMSIIISYVSQ
jgi:hypothetical protein